MARIVVKSKQAPLDPGEAAFQIAGLGALLQALGDVERIDPAAVAAAGQIIHRSAMDLAYILDSTGVANAKAG